MSLSIQTLSPATAQGVYVRPPKLNVFICDVSGSMSWVIRQLAEDTIVRIRQLPQGDGLLLGIFSSQGWHRWIIARELQESQDYDKAAEIITHEFYARNMTCFSEIVADTPKAMKPLLAAYQVVTFTFMSDGQPVTSDNRKEEQALDAAAKALAPFVSAGAIVGYGDYANRPLLSRLASTLGVEFVTTEHVKDIGETFAKHSAAKSRKRRRVEVPKDAAFVFAMDADGTVTPLDSKSKDVLASEDATVYVMQATAEKAAVMQEPVQYAAALALVGDGQVDAAMQTLSDVGDVALVQALGNALTNAELSKVEAQLRDAVTQPKARFAHGKQVGCLPKDDAFDLLDLLVLLMNDPDCRFYPRHPTFQYKRIGRASKVKNGYPTFVPDANVSVPLSRLVGHSGELNLSIGVTIPGTITLPDAVTLSLDPHLQTSRISVGLDATYITHIFRNYALISNALPSVTCLPLIFSSKEVLQRTLEYKMCDTKDGVYVLDLTKIPVCNRQRGKNAADWTALADLAYESLRLGSIAKVLRAKRDELDPARAGEQPVTLTPEQSVFLEACGVRRDGSFSPPTEQVEATDVMHVRTFEVKVQKGSPVSMKDFDAMVKGGKKVNFVGELMMAGYQRIGTEMPLQRTGALAWLHAAIADTEHLKRGIDADLNARRFAVALTGGWAKSFKNDEVEVKASNGHPVTLKMGVLEKKI